jgi:flagellar motor switch/type III secretory pathway protein FliN
MLGRPVSLDVVETWVADGLPSRPGDLIVGLSLEGPPGLVLSVDSLLAVRIASIVAGHPLERVGAPPALEAEIAGGVTAFLVVAARYAGTPWRLSESALPRGPFACLRAAASVGEDVFEVTAALPLAPSQPPVSNGAHPLAALGVDVDALASLGDVPLSLPVVVATTQATDADLAALAPGAAWVPGETWMARRGPDGTWRGASILAAPFAQAGLVAETDASGQWILQTWRRGSQSPTDGGTDEGLSAVRVEVGPVTLTAREWARLTPGAPLPPPFGDMVTLRADGRTVASGRVTTVNGGQAVLLEAMRDGRLGMGLRLLTLVHLLRLLLGQLPEDVEQPVELGPDVGINVAQVGLGPQPPARSFGVGAHVDGGGFEA